jgi:DNA-directed RNA polymerase specialized sigma subunit
MTAKECLEQAYHIDQRINSKLAQVESLRALAEKVTATLSDTPPDPSRNLQSMETTICKLVDLEREINADIDVLVELKRECVAMIKQIPNLEHQTLLEMRYLRFKTWAQIAKELGYSIRSVYRIHDAAQKNLDFLKVGSECHFYSPTSV